MMTAEQNPISVEGSDVEKTTKSADLTSTVSSEIMTDIDAVTESIKEEEPQVQLLVPWHGEHFQSYTRYDKVN